MRAACPIHEQHSHWQQIKPPHKRPLAPHVCQFGTGEDRPMEDAVARWKAPEPGAAFRPMVLIDGTRSLFLAAHDAQAREKILRELAVN
jgi:hypothetical protein